jgi:hypothetical protein
MREDDRRDVPGHVSERREIRREPACETRQPGVDRRQPAAILDEVPVDELATEAVDAGDDVWRRVDGGILVRQPLEARADEHMFQLSSLR